VAHGHGDLFLEKFLAFAIKVNFENKKKKQSKIKIVTLTPSSSISNYPSFLLIHA